MIKVGRKISEMLKVILDC